VDPTVAVENIKTLEQVRNDSLASRIFATRLLVGFSTVGSLLTLVSIFGVLSLSVLSRRRELAIRSALGAQRSDISKLMLGEAGRLIAGGVAAGIVSAFVLARALRSFLFDIKPTDPWMLVGASILFAAIGLEACWIPPRRAAASRCGRSVESRVVGLQTAGTLREHFRWMLKTTPTAYRRAFFVTGGPAASPRH
jgi:putative ABC transport system permease protein